MSGRAAHPVIALRDGSLHCESVPLEAIARRFGTPTFVYSRRAIVTAYRAYADALGGRPSLVCYAMKANSNLAILDLLAREGCGFDIVSGGELARALAVGADPQRIVFSGVGKTRGEIDAALAARIRCFNVESEPELELIEAVAMARGGRAPVSVRVNPDVDPQTHPYISTGLKNNKFGVAYADTRSLYQRAARSAHLQVVGIDCHIGSQITELAPYLDAADRILDLVQALESDGIELHHIDFGGGLGIQYRDEAPPTAGEVIRGLLQRVDARGLGGRTVMVEPGRSIVGAAGALLTRVEFLKHGEAKNFAIVDAAMNDLMRPALYQAWMRVEPVRPQATTPAVYDIVGPICESGDWLARERELALGRDALLAVLDAGAYAMSMASNYNSRPRAAEVMVDGERMYEVRSRETIAELMAGESTLP
jgi:diaminopimelate decarboxylase